jgi:hypothetical protein
MSHALLTPLLLIVLVVVCGSLVESVCCLSGAVVKDFTIRWYSCIVSRLNLFRKFRLAQSSAWLDRFLMVKSRNPKPTILPINSEILVV